MSLLLAVFGIVFVTELISWIGQSVLLEFAYRIYLRVFYSSLSTTQTKLKAEILNTKTELLKTSAQDQFAKWAKLRRSVDKGLAELETLNSQISSQRSGFSLRFNSFIWVLTTGLQLGVGWWYRRSAVFYLPVGWFGPLEWWLSFPFAPKGSISVGVWSMACKRFVKIGERVVKDFMSSPAPIDQVPVGEKKEAK